MGSPEQDQRRRCAENPCSSTRRQPPGADRMSKIIRLESTNYKRLKAVEIVPDPDGNLVIVAGKNGQGKTSILDSITAALGGVNGKTTPKPIRDGEDRAEIVLETEDLIVTRKFTASGPTLLVKSRD